MEITECPRCTASGDLLRIECNGYEAGRLIWTVRHCSACSFSWRDTEHERVIEHGLRPSWANIADTTLSLFPHNIPPPAT